MGTKADNLQLLSEAGFNIPKFRVIEKKLFNSLFFKNLNTNNLHENNLEQLYKNSKLELDTLANELLNYFKSININTIAIRSSANVEDGTFGSFAGLFNSYLYLSTIEEVSESILRFGVLY